MKERSFLTKLFLVTTAFTIISWGLAYVFTAMAGENPKTMLNKIELQVNNSVLTTESENLDFSGIEQLKVEGGSADILLTDAVEGQGLADFSGKTSAAGKVLRITKDGKQMIIQIENKNTNRFIWRFGSDDSLSISGQFRGLRLRLPPSAPKNIRVDSRSGDVTVEKVVGEQLALTASSGNIKVAGGRAKQMTLLTKSGDIEVRDFEGDLKASARSGEMEIGPVLSQHIELESTSGDIELKEPKSEQISARATSGDISVQVSDGTGWKFDLGATSGDIKNDWTNDPAGKKQMRLQATSGDIHVRR